MSRWWLLVLAMSACGEDEPPCVQPDLTCAPLYTPTFDELHARTLAPTCAPSGGACHSAEGRKGGLALEEADEAYDLLLDGRVEEGDARCSLMARRVGSHDRKWMMPPGGALPAAEQCVIFQWIAQGAGR